MSTSGIAGLVSCFITAIATSCVWPSTNTGETVLGPTRCSRSPCSACCASTVGAVTTPALAEQPVTTATAAASKNVFRFVSVRVSPPIGDDAERLGVGHAESPTGFPQPLPHEALDVAVTDLTLVTVQRSHLLVESLGDVDGRGLDGRTHQPALLALPPRLQALVEQLGKDRCSCAARHGDVERGLPDDAMVRMVDEPVRRQGVGDHREESVRLVATELPRQCPAELEGVEHLGVHPLQERHVVHTDRVGCCTLLGFPQCAVLVDVHVRVPRALLAAGHADIADVPTVAHPSRDGAGGTEVDVVRMREDRESSLLRHATTLGRF